MADNHNYHILEKWGMFMERGGVYAKCDYCAKTVGDKAEKHELISRGHLPKRMQAPILSRLVSAYLCSACHHNWHHGEGKQKMEKVLWGNNIIRYGEELREHLINLLEEHPSIILPSGVQHWLIQDADA